jgi:hypothetical protein
LPLEFPRVYQKGQDRGFPKGIGKSMTLCKNFTEIRHFSGFTKKINPGRIFCPWKSPGFIKNVNPERIFSL